MGLPLPGDLEPLAAGVFLDDHDHLATDFIARDEPTFGLLENDVKLS
jgi:hypothetical protein